ncbi:MAG: hypothetical protein LBD25_02585, partial [Coriobacteriales bacterium]|nr:hypothetical protein [Coriobacteriales bacterium]
MAPSGAPGLWSTGDPDAAGSEQPAGEQPVPQQAPAVEGPTGTSEPLPAPPPPPPAPAAPASPSEPIIINPLPGETVYIPGYTFEYPGSAGSYPYASPNLGAPSAQDPGGVAIAPLMYPFNPPGATQSASTWQELWNHVSDPGVSVINVTADITRATTAGNDSSGNRLPVINRPLKIVGTGGQRTIDFGSDDNAANSFNLGSATSGSQRTFMIDNVKLARSGAGTTALVNSSQSASNTAGWTVVASNVASVAATPVQRLVNVVGAAVVLDETVTWTPANNLTQVTAASLRITENATVRLAKQSGSAALVNLSGPLTAENRVSLTLSGGGIDCASAAVFGSNATLNASGGESVISVSGTALPRVEFGANSTVAIGAAEASRPTNGFLLATTDLPNTAGAASVVTFGSGSTVTINVVERALRATNITFDTNNVVNISNTSTSTSNDLIDMMPKKDGSGNLDIAFTVKDRTKMTLSAENTSCLAVGYASGGPVGWNQYPRNKTGVITVSGGADVTMSSNISEANTFGVVRLMGNAGGIFVTDAKLQVKSNKVAVGTSNGAAPCIMQQVVGGTFTVTGPTALLDLYQASTFSSFAAAIRFRYVGDQTFNVTNGGTLNIDRPEYYSRGESGSDGQNYGGAAALIRFGSGQNNTFNIASGGRVNLHNGGSTSYAVGNNGSLTSSQTYDTGSKDVGGNEVIEYSANGFAFNVQGADSTCRIVADRGAAINTYSFGGGTINVGTGCVFEVTGACGRGTSEYAAFYNTASGNNAATFTMNNPLYYDFTNKYPDGGSVANLGNGSVWTSTYSDVAIWRIGEERWNEDPGASFTLIDYRLNKSGGNWQVSADTASPAFTTSAAFRTWFGAPSSSNPNSLSNYTRISANNADPTLDDVLPATNADKHIRWTGTVPQGFDSVHQFYTDEVFCIVKVTKVGGAETSYPASMTGSLFQETAYEVEQNAVVFNGVLRFNNGAVLEAGDTYTVTKFWRGLVDGSRAHEGPISAPPVTVADIVPPPPAVITTPMLFESKNELIGTWTLGTEAHANPATKVFALKNGNPIESSPGVTHYGAVTGSNGGVWSYAFPASATLVPGDVVTIMLEDANGNATRVSGSTAIHDIDTQPAPTMTVQAVTFTITGTNKVIGLEDAKLITNAAQLKDLVEASASNDSNHESTPVSVKATDFLYGAAAQTGYYYVTVQVDARPADTETFYVYVRPG